MISRRFFLQGATGTLGASRLKPPVGWGCGLPDNPITSPIAGRSLKPQARKTLPRPVISCLDTSARRRLFKDLERGYEELLRRSYKKPDGEDPADPTSLLYQAWLHHYYCGKDMGQDVHQTWAFLPWHRAFLYFHERILQSIVGSHFRLPVWEWDQCDEVPSFFFDWAKIRMRCPYGVDNLQHRITPCILQAWLLSNSPTDFLGAVDTAGNAKSGPHDLVHGTFGFLMAGADTAAVDPLFYAHHANVDRFWEHWRRTYKFSDDPSWLGQTFGFHDENANPVTISVSDLLDLDALGYYYHTPSARELIYNYNIVKQVGQDNHSESVFFNVTEIIQIIADELGLRAEAVESAIAENPARLQSLMVPARITGTPHGARIGHYYFVGIRAVGDNQDLPTTHIIGGFAIFMTRGMGEMEVVATCCFQATDLQFIVDNHGQVRFVWGQPDSTLIAIGAGQDQPFWPIQQAVILRRVPPRTQPH